MKKTVILTFDDAVTSQLTHAVPVLLQHGFGATFYICRFDDEWRAKHSQHLLTLAEVKKLHDLGFEIGNHTWSHPNLNQLTVGEIDREVGSLNDWLAGGGIPAPVTFAYPGGPYVDKAVPVLKAHHLKAARIVGDASLDLTKFDPMRIPAIAVQKDDFELFLHALSFANVDRAAVLVFHGTPDIVHPWVDTSAGFFARCMAHLHEHDYHVCSLRDYLQI